MYLDYKRLLQHLFPLSDDENNVANILPEDFISKIQLNSSSEVSSLLAYSDIHVRSAIHLLKFHNHTHAKSLLSAVLVTYLTKALPHRYIIIPVPLSKKRQRQRGYNQVTELVKDALHSLPSAEIETGILIRPLHTTPQTSLSRTQRLQNVKKSFSVRNTKSAQQKISGRHVVLIDDVITTGATLQAAKAALTPLCPASITCIALAH